MINSSIPLFWRLKDAKYRLIGTKCSKCEGVFFPPRSFCPKCRSKGRIEKLQFSGQGVIVSYTIIRSPPEGFEKQSPYAVAIVKLDEGAQISGQIIDDPTAIETGKKVKAVFRKMYEDGADGVINYGFKFRLV